MATHLTEGVWQIDCQTRDHPNVYVVDDGDWTLIDAGWPGDESTVRAGLSEVGIELNEIDRVLLTHYDADHVGTLAQLTPELDAPVYIHHEEANYITGETLPPWTARNGLEALHRLYYRRLALPDLPVRSIGDGDDIGEFVAHHTPGHTPGHTVYVHSELDAAFLGDLAYAMGDGLRPAGWVTSYDSRWVADSIRQLLTRISEFEYACPGHGQPMADGYEQLSQAVDS